MSVGRGEVERGMCEERSGDLEDLREQKVLND